MAVPFSPRSLKPSRSCLFRSRRRRRADEGEVGEEAAQRRLKEIEDYIGSRLRRLRKPITRTAPIMI